MRRGDSRAPPDACFRGTEVLTCVGGYRFCGRCILSCVRTASCTDEALCFFFSTEFGAKAPRLYSGAFFEINTTETSLFFACVRVRGWACTFPPPPKRAFSGHHAKRGLFRGKSTLSCPFCFFFKGPNGVAKEGTLHRAEKANIAHFLKAVYRADMHAFLSLPFRRKQP